MPTGRIGRQYYPVMKGNPLSSNDIAIITKIIGQFVDRSRKDLADWRQAIDAADHPEQPNWQPLQDFYDYLSTDGHLGSVKELRKGNILANRFFVRDRATGKEDNDKTNLLKKEWIYDLHNDLLDCNFFDYTLVQITDPINGKYDLLPRRNFVPQLNFLKFDAQDPNKGVDIYDPSFKGTIICVRGSQKFGIMNDVIPDLVWKKNARQAWAEFSAKFGDPLLTATTNKTNQKDIDRIDNMLAQLGQASRAVLPEGTTVDIKNEAKQGDPYNLWLKQMDYCDKQISKRFVGGTMLNDDGSSRSQSEVHERNLNYIIGDKDRKKIEFVMNGKILPLLASFGMDFNENDEFVYDRNEDLPLNAQWTIINQALEHYDIPDEWVSETFGFPIVGKKISEPVAPPDPATTRKSKAPTSFFG